MFNQDEQNQENQKNKLLNLLIKSNPICEICKEQIILFHEIILILNHQEILLANKIDMHFYDIKSTNVTEIETIKEELDYQKLKQVSLKDDRSTSSSPNQLNISKYNSELNSTEKIKKLEQQSVNSSFSMRSSTDSLIFNENIGTLREMNNCIDNILDISNNDNVNINISKVHSENDKIDNQITNNVIINETQIDKSNYQSKQKLNNYKTNQSLDESSQRLKCIEKNIKMSTSILKIIDQQNIYEKLVIIQSEIANSQSSNIILQNLETNLCKKYENKKINIFDTGNQFDESKFQQVGGISDNNVVLNQIHQQQYDEISDSFQVNTFDFPQQTTHCNFCVESSKFITVFSSKIYLSEDLNSLSSYEQIKPFSWNIETRSIDEYELLIPYRDSMNIWKISVMDTIFGLGQTQTDQYYYFDDIYLFQPSLNNISQIDIKINNIGGQYQFHNIDEKHTLIFGGLNGNCVLYQRRRMQINIKDCDEKLIIKNKYIKYEGQFQDIDNFKIVLDLKYLSKYI